MSNLYTSPTLSPKRPSPLSPNSPRTTPFTRTGARPASPSPTPSRTHSPAPTRARDLPTPPQPQPQPHSPANADRRTAAHAAPQRSAPQDVLARLNPARLREMRESFQVLDRDGDGSVDGPDVAEALGQVGLPSDTAAVSAFFNAPGAAGGRIALSTYLNTLGALLGRVSRPEELSAAFAAFDADDSGQVDVGELREALLHGAAGEGGLRMGARDVDAVMGEFSGRRAFGTGRGATGDVFRYRDFVGAVGGGVREGRGEAVEA